MYKAKIPILPSRLKPDRRFEHVQKRSQRIFRYVPGIEQSRKALLSATTSFGYDFIQSKAEPAVARCVNVVPQSEQCKDCLCGFEMPDLGKSIPELVLKQRQILQIPIDFYEMIEAFRWSYLGSGKLVLSGAVESQ
nr:hypothetical protein CFP56_24366 [Quercus suber]